MKSNINKRDVTLFMAFSFAYYFLFTYKSFNNFFYFDDLDTLSWIHVAPTTQFILDTFDFNYFAGHYFYRPLGSMVHSICYKLFGLNFLPFHIVATIIHLFNLVVIYILIRKFVPSRSAVFLGAFLYTFHLTAMPIYWHFFGTFDSLCATFLLLSFLFYIKASDRFNMQYLFSFFFFILALRSKEMPLSFPLILVVYEILIQRKIIFNLQSFKHICRSVWPFFTIALVAGLLKLFAQVKVDKVSSYSVHFDLLSLLDGFHYFVKSALSEMRLPLYSTLALLVILGIVPLLLKSRTLAFAYFFTLIALLPLLPLANRRVDYNQYIPLIGVSLYSAELFHCLQIRLRQKGRKFLTMLYVVVGFLCVLHSQRNWQVKKYIEDFYLNIAKENREFTRLIAPHRAGPSALYLYDSAPLVLSTDSGVFAVLHLLFHDYTVTVKSIPDCSKNVPPAIETDVGCISFKKRKVQIWRAKANQP